MAAWHFLNVCILTISGVTYSVISPLACAALGLKGGSAELLELSAAAQPFCRRCCSAA